MGRSDPRTFPDPRYHAPARSEHHHVPRCAASQNLPRSEVPALHLPEAADYPRSGSTCGSTPSRLRYDVRQIPRPASSKVVSKCSVNTLQLHVSRDPGSTYGSAPTII